MASENLAELEKKLDLTFSDKDLLHNAFIHRSYLNENASFQGGSNERLEFLGDACLELAVSEYLFRHYPENPEGDLTNFRSAVVNTHSLAETARELGLGAYLHLSRGEEAGNGRDSEYLLANTFEALLGAIYLEFGYKVVTEVVQKYITAKLEYVIEHKLYKDAKSKLQELSQEVLSITPHYEIVEEWGPDHQKMFKVGAFIGKKQVGLGEGSSKQKAELAAAQQALEDWES
jgi:ribonuclease-3